MPEASQSRGCSSKKIGRVIGERRDQGSSYDKRHSQPENAVTQKAGGSLSIDASPHKQSGEKEHQRHKKNLVESDEQSEAAPALAIDHGKGLPPAGLRDQRGGHRRREGMVPQHRMMGEHQDSDERSQVSNGQVARTRGLPYDIGLPDRGRQR
jgi:hypothetical protein